MIAGESKAVGPRTHHQPGPGAGHHAGHQQRKGARAHRFVRNRGGIAVGGPGHASTHDHTHRAQDAVAHCSVSLKVGNRATRPVTLRQLLGDVEAEVGRQGAVEGYALFDVGR